MYVYVRPYLGVGGEVESQASDSTDYLNPAGGVIKVEELE